VKNVLIATAIAAWMCGCASDGGGGSGKTYTGPEGVTYHQDHDIQGVWMVDGFNFSGYDSVFVAEPTSNAESRSDEERKVLETAKRELRNDLTGALQDIHLFQRVVTSMNDIPAGSKVLTLENNIYHHEKGGGGARFFAGLYGAGQPVIKVSGKMRSGDQVLFRYDMTRSGESGGAHLGGGYMNDENIQAEDIKDLAKDLAAFVDRTAKGLPAK